MPYVPGQKVSYATPGRFSATKVLLILVALTGTYLGFAWVPPYWRYWKVHSVLKEELDRTHSVRRDESRFETVKWEMQRRIRSSVSQVIKVPPEQIVVSVFRSSRFFSIKAKWRAQAKYPFIGKASDIWFSREVRAEMN